MKTKAQFTFDKVPHNKENNLHLVVSLEAPKIDWQKRRAAICVIPVIDCSQSMRDYQKMEYTKQSVIKLIDHLQPGDYLGLIGFSLEPFVISEPVKITQESKDALKAKVGELQPMSWTNFSDGMVMALEHGNKMDLPAGTQVRLVMFTDGMANKGVATTQDALVALVKKAKKECSVSAFGYGLDADQSLLAEVAKAGDGNYAFIKNPEDALAAFGKELGGLLSTYGTNIVVELAPNNGHRVSEVISDVDVEEDGNKVTIKLSDILAEETRNLVFAVKLSEQKQALPREVNAFDIKITYETVDENGKKHKKTEELKAKVRFTKEGDAQEKPTKAVDEIVALAQLAKKQIEAEKYAASGNFAQAALVMNNQALSFQERGLNNYAAVASAVSGSVGSHGTFTSTGGYRSSMLRSAGRQYSVSAMDASAEVQLKSLNLSTTNATQSAFVSSFVDPNAGAAAGTVNPGGAVWVAGNPAPTPVQNDQTVAGAIPGDPKAKLKKKNKKDGSKSVVTKSKSSRW